MSSYMLEGHRCATAHLHTVARLECGGDIAGRRSLQRQTEQRWQCVLVDDGSDDGSLACTRWFAAQDARFTVVATSQQGLVAALHTQDSHTATGALWPVWTLTT